MKKENYNRTWVEIDKGALKKNVAALRKCLGSKVEFMAVVKANAYGHGLIEIAQILKGENIDWFSVFDPLDAGSIRKISNKPILILESTPESFWEEAIKKNLSLTISTFEQLEYLKKLKKKPRVHIKIDSGLGRQGFTKKDQKKVLAFLQQLPKETVEGLYTHFSGTESRIFDSYTKTQFENLLDWKNALSEVGIHPKVHASATSGALRSDQLQLDIARFGIGLYGLWPSEETKLLDKGRTKLMPVLSWRTKISEVKNLSKGSSIAYDCTYTLKKDATVALLPVGYWDGIPRHASSRAYILVRGKACPILGRVMMNMCVIDISGIKNVERGSIATIIGQDLKSYVSAEMLAQASDTINYEIVTRINPLISRFVK